MNIKRLVRVLGPGLLYAGAAIGVSHLIQSTRAGAGFGFDLVWVLILVHILKYPFFEFAPRYASSTGSSLIEGYKKLGRWALLAFALLTITTMFTILAAVTIVTAGLFANVFNLAIGVVPLSALILGCTVIILIIGKFAFLDKLIKLVIVLLAVSTVVAVVSAFGHGYHPDQQLLHHFNWLSRPDMLFLIAFIGWMPAPLDVAVWSSIWNIEKSRSLAVKPSINESLMDFRIGYTGTAFLALCFLTLGALVMHGSGEELSAKGSVFAGQLIEMYTVNIGQWSHLIISIAALMTMFSTTLTVVDAYPRVLRPITAEFVPALAKAKNEHGLLYWGWIIIVSGGALALLKYFASSMTFMVDVATTLSFITAPFLAVMNYILITSKHVPKHARPGFWLRVWAWTGIVFLGVFTLFYAAWRFGWIAF